MPQGEIVLEIGPASCPWILYNPPKGDERIVPRRIIPRIKSYTCVDILREELEEARARIRKKNSPCARKFQLIQADGGRLPSPSETFDVVIASDVLSLPEEDYCSQDYKMASKSCFGMKCSCHQKKYWGQSKTGCWCRMCAGCTPENKVRLLHEMIRVLKKDGRLIVTVYQAPWLAESALELLLHEPRLALEEDISWKVRGFPDYLEEWDILWEKVFRKRNSAT